MVIHKSKAITYITEDQRLAAVRQQTLVIQGKGKLWGKAKKGLSNPDSKKGS